ncbi:energy-coupling factor ABC transporter ATP-binding protein [[Clostridium] polysaccharolyticum]|uniref:Cobalt/nickel transport system ATP-binding protein n=1 Tax=[Clostridium] polysaccharolyticum TaxID=29364 RepID=A0A1H9Z8V1_9FIRM|nr:ABC transporter ATP-binding protein [[Clostridium] polysaccharolyticum]SES77977.1 cobalt/nickel transport system ATP-binding protein [[Clostridium] polysaccharolyticum]
MKKNILELKNVSFSYEDGKKALDGVSVSIYAGEKIAVLGANGAGKSTFFLHLNGVRTGDSGEIYLAGEKICNKKQRKKLQENVGIVFQDTDSQIIASTVKSEIAFGPMNMNLTREQVETYTMDAIRQMELEDYVDRPPHYLSGGEKKRVGIADILAMKPKIVVFDEPTASLDPVSAQMLEETLEQLEREGKTILLSTHDVDFAYRFAERVLVFCNGKMIADDSPEAIFMEEDLLKATNLKKPVIMEVYELLKKKKLLKKSGLPKNLEELERLLQ